MSAIHDGVRQGREALATSAHVSVLVERAVAYLAVFALALRFPLHPLLPLGYVVAVAALPVTLGVASRYRGARSLVAVAALAMLSGLLLTWLLASADYFSPSQTIIQGGRVLMVGVGTLLLLWARSVLGARSLVFTYALGSFAALGVVGLNEDNLWKFSFAVPVTLLLLALPMVYRRPMAETLILLGLGVFSALNDSRSAAAMMLIAAALVVAGPRSSQVVRSSWTVLLKLGLYGVGGFLLLQAALLNGDLGESARQRTMEQIETSGSVLLGGRPEAGATVALLTDAPWGFGVGTLVTPSQVLTAKAGMASLGYDPNNGYVENYMFGNGFEVHSVLGDLWLLAGLPGLALAILVAVLVAWGMAHQISRRAASGVMIFLSIRALWDFAFSPLPSAILTLMLCLALVMPERDRPQLDS